MDERTVAIRVLNAKTAVVPYRAPQCGQELARRLGLIPAPSIEMDPRPRLFGGALRHVGKSAVEFFERAVKAALEPEVGERTLPRDE